VKKSFTLSEPIIKAIWASFGSELQKNYLCVLHREGLRIYGPDGRVFSVMLPCRMSQIWPLPHGRQFASFLIFRLVIREGSIWSEPVR
jgi:anaphase-promoting complex subunit 1